MLGRLTCGRARRRAWRARAAGVRQHVGRRGAERRQPGARTPPPSPSARTRAPTHAQQRRTLSVEPLNWMPLNASALLASCTLRSLMNAYGGPFSRVMLQPTTLLPLSSCAPLHVMSALKNEHRSSCDGRGGMQHVRRGVWSSERCGGVHRAAAASIDPSATPAWRQHPCAVEAACGARRERAWPHGCSSQAPSQGVAAP